MSKTFRKVNISALSMLSLALIGGVVLAANTPTFQLTINPGSLGVDIVDAAYEPVASPTVPFNDVTASLDCTSTTGTLGTATEQIYITNPDAADDGYTVSLASSVESGWSDGENSFSYRDESNNGCNGGQLTVAGGIISDGKLASDLTAGIVTTGGSFTSEVSSVTLVNASVESADISEVVATGFGLTQTIPARTPASSYSLPMTLSIIANGGTIQH